MNKVVIKNLQGSAVTKTALDAVRWSFCSRFPYSCSESQSKIVHCLVELLR